MSRRRPANHNNVRGPTSALTAFLRAWFHHPRRAATRQQQQQQDDDQQQDDGQQGDGQPQAGPSNAQPEASSSTSTPSRRPSRAASRRVSGYGSDNLDDEDEDGDGDVEMKEATDNEPEQQEAVESPAPAKKRKLSKKAEAKLKAEEKKKMKGKKGKGGDDDDDYDDEDDDPYTSLSKAMWTNSGSKPAPGSFENCARCKKQFTVTKYTMTANPPPGWLCHVCAKSSGQDPFKKPAAPKKRKTAADKREITHFVENRLPTLVTICIRLVTKHIDDVESLGDIGTLNLEAIAKAMSKNRSLTPDNAKLFYNASNPRLTFYDATNITPAAFETLVYLNPNLTSLRLDFCGQLDDTAFKVFCTSLPALTHIELLGPFLVRAPMWQEFAKSHPNLEAFLITQSPRFDLECIKALVKHCPGLKELRLKEFAKMSDVFLEELAALGEGLTYLDISCPGGESCSEAAIIQLLESVGGSLKSLDVAKHDDITDRLLKEGLIPHVHHLDTLNLSHLNELTDEGVGEFFSTWENPPLVHLDISRNPDLGTKALEAIMKHSGKTLEVLNINGFKDVEEPALRTIGRLGKEMRKLDVGFCRNVDDFVIKAWLEGEEAAAGAEGVGVQ
ncbi:DNA dependent ATPase [Coprinopsis cinerea okayama7|uniref:DNA dependent ATPase n=1 Tax=Coprinopsis cinerea (strain Okayama-7 / 130 / ATCC MYA-4618 / FGSC 9003) TaxID=240176 RepID=D6RKU5_COPC7|nr:DNA dependent ATPase [Coprinopsis cinerea okayama7\|eukprot:XP_002911993.1 DNA dependent ATPase [Coprinopsis cinerea okayama7\